MMMSELLGTAPEQYSSYIDQTQDDSVETQTYFHPMSKLNDSAMQEYGLKTKAMDR